MRNKPTLYILCGRPYSGKTTLARELARRFGFEIVSMDSVMERKGLDLLCRKQLEFYCKCFVMKTKL